ncbi:hypothetical protein ACFLU5_02335 [Bacteroidota bacterium]
MKKNIGRTSALIIIIMTWLMSMSFGQTPYFDQTKDGFLVFHEIKTDEQGKIIPWYHTEPGISYDFVIKAVWNFWDTMRIDMNGLPYYMNHQVWRPEVNDRRGIGGDQISMALSSWRLLYQYSGWEKVKENMMFLADYNLTHSLSLGDAAWPDIPYPYNNLRYSGTYTGDMVIGMGYTQPDKAGSFGYEVFRLYQMTGTRAYLDAAEKIARTLAMHIREGDDDHSPLPFKVHAITGEVGKLKSNRGSDEEAGESGYTTNWTAMLRLFLGLIDMNKDTDGSLQHGFEITLDWMKEYPMKTNKWGPFFEDIPGWSDTQTNAISFAHFMMDYPDYFAGWEKDVEGIFDWVYEKLGNSAWEKYGVTVVNEQTVYQTPGNSHTSRQASMELLYCYLTGKDRRKNNAIRQLNWATYMVDNDGKNCYPRDEVWLTDGYGDYVRHFLRSMAAFPVLAPSNGNHILKSTSVISQADYNPDFHKKLAPDFSKEESSSTLLFYKTYDNSSTEILRLVSRPSRVLVNHREIMEQRKPDIEGWHWEPLDKGGILTITHQNGNHIRVIK